jgi:type II secretory pathway component PulM
MNRIGQWWRTRAPRERRIITVGVIVAVVYGFVSYVFDPLYSQYHANHIELESQKDLLKRYERLIQNKEKIVEQQSMINAMDKSVDEVLLGNTTTELASAELQGLIKNIAKKFDISFTKITPQKPVESNGFYEISLKTPFQGSIHQIQQLLYALDKTSKMIHITKLNIKGIRRNPTDLRVELVVTAYINSPDSVPKDDRAGKISRST